MDTKTINQNLTPIKNRLLPPCKLREQTQEPQLSDYKEIKILGKGGFGVVSLGQHLKTKKYYALKKMAKSKLTKTVLKAIQSEIEIMMPLDHENIIKLYDYFEDDNAIILILEYAEGQQLYEKLSAMPQQRFDDQLANAIAYLHNKDPAILHRDIKPENLMLNKDKKIKLVDFGWSNYFEQDQIPRKTVCGTAAYLSPEMILGTGNDKMHDMWCVGVLIYEFLTGRDPFSPDPSQFTSQKPFERKLYQNILKKAPSFPKNFPPLARDLVEKLLQKKTKDRLDVNQMLQHAWITQEFTENTINALSSEQQKLDSNNEKNTNQNNTQSQTKQEVQSPNGKNQEQQEKIKKLEELNNKLQAKSNQVSSELIEKDNEISVLKAQKEDLQNSWNKSQELILSLESQLEIEKKQWQNQIKLLEKGIHDNTELKSIQMQLDQKELEFINLKMSSSEQITKLTNKLAHCKQKKHLLEEKLKSTKTNDHLDQEGEYQSQDIVRKSIHMRQSLSMKQTERLCPEDGTLLRELTKILNYVEKAQETQENKINIFQQAKQQDQLSDNLVELKDQQQITTQIDELLKKRQQEDIKINQSIKQVQGILQQKKQEKVQEELIKELELSKKFVNQLKKEVELLQKTNSQLQITVKELEMEQE